MTSVCSPLTSVEEVLEFNKRGSTWHKVYPLQVRSIDYLAGEQTTCNAIVKCHQKLKHTPRTIVCHDMKGGYLDDKYAFGSNNWQAYRFFHWAGIDAFIYFSHHFITIPPVGWVNAAHLHGVKVLGTVITEHEENNFWNLILEGGDEYYLEIDRFIDSLINICIYYGFDGYLLNVENTVPKHRIHKLIYFVETLTSRLRDHVPHKLVIWYDSVTICGELKWQNELNHYNKPFFDVCDGIFLNYTWKEESLKRSADLAQTRLFDVYVGIDVFGRGCFGGGGFNSCQAVEAARKYGLSIAIFAPGWTHECLGSENFATHEYIFWKKLWKYLYIHGPSTLPFSTSFCQGFGLKEYNRGFVRRAEPWYDLSRQQYQPTVCSCISDEICQRMLKNTQNVNTETNSKVLNPEFNSENNVRLNGDSGIAVHNGHIEDGATCIENVTVEKRSESAVSHINNRNDLTLVCGGNSFVTDNNSVKNSSQLFSKKHASGVMFEETDNYAVDEDTKSPTVKSNGFKMLSSASSSIETLSTEFYKLKNVSEVFDDTLRLNASDKQESENLGSSKESLRAEINIAGNNTDDISTVSENGENGLGILSHPSGCLQIYNEDAFIGGGCLKISKHFSSKNNVLPISFHRILSCEFDVEGLILVTVVTKNICEENTFLDFIIESYDPISYNYREKVLIDAEPQKNLSNVKREPAIFPVNINTLLKRGMTAKKLSTTEIQIPEREGWKVRYYVLNLPPAHVITDISTKLYGYGDSILLGLLSLATVYFRYR